MQHLGIQKLLDGIWIGPQHVHQIRMGLLPRSLHSEAATTLIFVREQTSDASLTDAPPVNDDSQLWNGNFQVTTGFQK